MNPVMISGYEHAPSPSAAAPAPARPSYLDTVLSCPSVDNESIQTQQRHSNYSEFLRQKVAETLVKRVPEPDMTATRAETLSKATLPGLHHFYDGLFGIDCNECGKSIPNEHFHCGTCEKGDFDLCQSCVDGGVTCDGADHWLIKRFIQNDTVVPSRTEKVPPKNPYSYAFNKEPAKKVIAPAQPTEIRTCNSCIESKYCRNSYVDPFKANRNFAAFPEDSLVTCKDCPDFDLCFSCFQKGGHGHHPGHAFRLVDETQFVYSPVVNLLPAGRGVMHEAVCDGCDKVSRADGFQYQPTDTFLAYQRCPPQMLELPGLGLLLQLRFERRLYSSRPPIRSTLRGHQYPYLENCVPLWYPL